MRVLAPASIANLGCLFDLAAMAIDIGYDKVTIELSRHPEIKVISRSKEVPGGRENVAYHAAAAVLEMYEKRGEVGLRIEIEKGVRVGVGLGSSGATAAAVAVGVDKLLGGRLTQEEIIAASAEGERAIAGSIHYDNVSASVLGGLALIVSRKPLKVVKLLPPAGLSFIILIPKVKTPERKTEAMRGILPSSIDLDISIEQSSAVLEFMLGILTHDLRMLGRAMSRGGIVERVRGSRIENYWKIKQIALEAGALGCNLAGAGPSIFVAVEEAKANEIARRLRRLLGDQGIRTELFITRPEPRGALEMVSLG